MRKKSLLTLPVVVLSILALLMTAVPAFAMDPQPPIVPIDLTVAGGQGAASPPIIKCKWEEPDDDLVDLGIEIDPVLWDNDEGFGAGQKQVCYYAVVTDPNGVGDIRGINDLNESGVFAEVFQPTLAGCSAWPAPLGEFKYQVRLEPIDWCYLLQRVDPMDPCDKSTESVMALKAIFVGMNEAGTMTLNIPYFNGIGIFDEDEMKEDIADQLVQDHALLFKGCALLDYHQPCGIYRVEVYAYDDSNDPSELLVNSYEYRCTAGIALDFTEIHFGEVTVCVEQLITGDPYYVPGDNKPSVKNIGNVPVSIWQRWSDLFNCTSHAGLGKTNDDWNVVYDSRLGIGGEKNYFNPVEEDPLSPNHNPWDAHPLWSAVAPLDEPAALPITVKEPPDPIPNDWMDLLGLCNEEKLEFSVHVKKAPSGCYTGEVDIWGEAAPGCGP
jgi:hypothetical protein